MIDFEKLRGDIFNSPFRYKDIAEKAGVHVGTLKNFMKERNKKTNDPRFLFNVKCLNDALSIMHDNDDLSFHGCASGKPRKRYEK